MIFLFPKNFVVTSTNAFQYSELRLREMYRCLVLVKQLGRSLRVIIVNPLFNTSYDVFEEWIVFIPQQQSWRELVTSFFLSPRQFTFINLLFLSNFIQLSGNGWFDFANILCKITYGLMFDVLPPQLPLKYRHRGIASFLYA